MLWQLLLCRCLLLHSADCCVWNEYSETVQVCNAELWLLLLQARAGASACNALCTAGVGCQESRNGVLPQVGLAVALVGSAECWVSERESLVRLNALHVGSNEHKVGPTARDTTAGQRKRCRVRTLPPSTQEMPQAPARLAPSNAAAPAHPAQWLGSPAACPASAGRSE